jgi:pyruvate/2-oxoacid:ferredoxin oxidoreductase alpha subunit
MRAGLFEPKTGWPFPEKGLRETVRSTEPRALCVVEMSILGQIEEDVRLALSLDGGAPLSHIPVFSVRTSGGVVPTIDEIVAEVSSAVAKLDKE